MNNDLMEDALSGLDGKLVESALDTKDYKRKKKNVRRTIIVLLVLLAFTGGYIGNRILRTASEISQKERESADKTGFAHAALNSYALGLAAYPVLPEAPDSTKLTEALNSPGMQGLFGEQRREKLIREAEVQKEAYQKALQELRKDGVDPSYTEALEEYTKRTADRILKENGSGNTVYSPVNLYLALSMLAETAGNDSRKELTELLGVSDIEEVRTLSNALWRNLYREDADGKTLLANSVWLKEDLPVHQNTVDTLAQQYYADIFSVPMGTEPTDAALQSWINERTQNLLKESVRSIKTNPQTAAMLVSTLYFKDKWKWQFSHSDNKEDLFTDAQGVETRTEFMCQELGRGHDQTMKFYREEGAYTVAELPFLNGGAMVFLLPDENVPLQSLIDSNAVTEGLLRWKDKDSFKTAEIHWRVPKFDVDSQLPMIEMLKSLGVKAVFDAETADFSPLTENNVFVSEVKQGGRVVINEEGCEAASYSTVMFLESASNVDAVIDMNLNRPFAFMITGVDGLPLFIGVVNEV